MLKDLLFRCCCFALVTVTVVTGSDVQAPEGDAASVSVESQIQQQASGPFLAQNLRNSKLPFLMSRSRSYDPLVCRGCPCKPCCQPPCCKYPVLYVIVVDKPPCCDPCKPCCGTCKLDEPSKLCCEPCKPCCDPCKPCGPCGPCCRPMIYLAFNKRFEPISFGQLMDLIQAVLKPCLPNCPSCPCPSCPSCPGCLAHQDNAAPSKPFHN